MDLQTFRSSSSYTSRAHDVLRNPNSRTMIPCFLTRGASSPNLPHFEKGKALMPKALPFGIAIHALFRKNLPALDPSIGLFYFVHVYKGDNLTPEPTSGISPRSDDLCINVYENYKSDDGFLYITYVGESVFGSEK